MKIRFLNQNRYYQRYFISTNEGTARVVHHVSGRLRIYLLSNTSEFTDKTVRNHLATIFQEYVYGGP